MYFYNVLITRNFFAKYHKNSNYILYGGLYLNTESHKNIFIYFYLENNA